jgi:hypothetical protein
MLKISHLGRILFFILLPIIAFSNVVATLDKIAVLEGDAVTLTIQANGDDIQFPKLRTVEGFKVLGTSSSSSLQIINGSVNRSKSISYKFIPKYSFRVPVYSVLIDGVQFETEELRLKVVKPTASKDTDDIQLELKLSQNKAYVGEAIIASVYFKYKIGTPLLDISLEEFYLKHFWIKRLKASEPYEENGYIILKQDFIASPQLAGKYKIPKQIIEVAKREQKTNMIRREKIFSNDMALEILPLPNGVDIQGDFKIEGQIDKSSTKANEPINLTITIKGIGNINDIDEIKLPLEEQIVYSSKPTIKSDITNNKYGGTFTQKLSIIADKDYTIAPISFRYFDKKTKKIKTIKTKSFDIKVKINKTTKPTIEVSNKQNTKTIQLPPKIIYKQENSYIKYIFLVVGLFIGGLISFIILKTKKQNTKPKPIQIQIKKAKSNKALYSVLLPYSYDQRVVNIIKQLEENIYNGKNNKIDKKELIAILENI